MGDRVAPAAPILEKHPLGQPLLALDGADLAVILRAAYDWLARHHELVNRLNVFPVPDGDTGDNMLLTMKSALMALESHPAERFAEVMAVAATGARHGSRGNSGVILGQILHGMAQAAAHIQDDGATARDLAVAWVHGADVAYASVPTPIEGTILTVAAAIAATATSTAASSIEIRALFDALVSAAERAVAQTPELLPILRETGVVDSGAKGLFFIVEGMQRGLLGLPNAENSDDHLIDLVNTAIDRQFDKGRRELPSARWGFDVQFLVEQPAKSVAHILSDIAAMGDYPLVEGDQSLVKVHVHVADPGIPLSYAVRLGFVTDVVVENMDDLAANAHIGLPVDEKLAPAPMPAADEIGVVAVASGQGFARIFRNLGAHRIVEGGQSMNPSTQELMDAIRNLPARRVVVLPNNSNVILAAKQAAQLVTGEGEQEVAVADVTTLAQGVAALLAFSPGADHLEQAVAAMLAQASAVHSGEVTVATRAARFDAVQVEPGDVIGLHDGRLAASGRDPSSVVLELLERMDAGAHEIVTLYYGDAIIESSAENLAEIVRNRYPEQDVELAFGGQPHYSYILSVE